MDRLAVRYTGIAAMDRPRVAPIGHLRAPALRAGAGLGRPVTAKPQRAEPFV
jgi:hypothetical protein